MNAAIITLVLPMLTATTFLEAMNVLVLKDIQEMALNVQVFGLFRVLSI